MRGYANNFDLPLPKPVTTKQQARTRPDQFSANARQGQSTANRAYRLGEPSMGLTLGLQIMDGGGTPSEYAHTISKGKTEGIASEQGQSNRNGSVSPYAANSNYGNFFT